MAKRSAASMSSDYVHSPWSIVHGLVTRYCHRLSTTDYGQNLLLVIAGLIFSLSTPCSWAETAGEARFFKGCPSRPPVHWHNEANAWDPHALLYTAAGLAEVEILRAADWMIDVSVPGRSVQPFRRTTEAIRLGYSRLPQWLVIRRFGQLVDALQLSELSLSDTTTTYSVSTGGSSMPGSGIVIRAQKVVDWTQSVVGDINRLSGRPFARREGLVTWTGPTRAVDAAQRMFLNTFHQVGITVARTLDNTLTGVERVGEGAVNMWRPRPHRDTTVFLWLPMGAYRAHELWILEHRPQLIVGAREEFAHTTHAEVARRSRMVMLEEWAAVDRSAHPEGAVVLMTTTRVMARAPESLKAFVVPAAWVLGD